MVAFLVWARFPLSGFVVVPSEANPNVARFAPALPDR
jgi:hypothetical protein